MVGDGAGNEGNDGKLPGSSFGRGGRVGERGEEYIGEVAAGEVGAVETSPRDKLVNAMSFRGRDNDQCWKS